MKSRMNGYVAVGITIGVLAGLWTWVSVTTGLITWVAFVCWALFFAAGGRFAAVLKVVPAAITGVIYGALLLVAIGAVGGPVALPVGIAVIAFLMCVQANWAVLAFIPGAFAGCATLFGGAGDWLGVSIALICGALLGWLSEAAATVLNRTRVTRKSGARVPSTV
jgi:hypothetical protein